MTDLRGLTDKAAELVSAGKLDAALGVYQQALAAAPRDGALRQKLAETLQRLGRSKEAVSAYQEAALELAKQGELLRAIAVCKVLLALDPKHVRTQTLLADLYAQKRGAAGVPAGGTRAVSSMPRSVSGEFDLDHAPSSLELGAPKPFPLFSSLSAEAFVAVLEGMELRTFESLQHVVKEGAAGDSMFAIVDGSLNVVRQAPGEEPKIVAHLSERDFFGEIALIADTPRLASVIATGRCTLLEFSRARMDQIVARHPAVGEVMQAFYRERLLANVLRSSPLFSDLLPAHKTDVARAFTTRTAKPGDELVQYGVSGDTLFLLLRGRCLPFHPQPGGRETKYPEMSEGEIFGEISLLLGKPATASVRAVTPCTLLCLHRPDFERIVLSHPAIRSRLMQMSFERLQRTAKVLSGRLV